MSSNRILGVAVAVLIGVGTVLAYRLWSQPEPAVPGQTSDSVPGRQLAGVSQPPLAAAPNLSVASGAAPVTAAATSEPAPAPSPKDAIPGGPDRFLTGMVDPQREALRSLPSWLPIPESQKDELARLTVALEGQFRFHPDPARLSAEQRVAKAYWEELKTDTPRKIEQLLGPSVYSLWSEYRETAVARSQLSTLNSRLADQALHEDTLRSMASVMTHAAQRADAERQAKYGDMPPGPTTLETLAMRRETSLRSDELMRAAVRPYLASSAQVKAFEEVQRQRQVEQEKGWTSFRIQIEEQMAKKARQEGR